MRPVVREEVDEEMYTGDGEQGWNAQTRHFCSQRCELARRDGATDEREVVLTASCVVARRVALEHGVQAAQRFIWHKIIRACGSKRYDGNPTKHAEIR